MSVAATPSQTVGPFFYFGLCTRPDADLVDSGDGAAVELAGRVLDGAGEPVPDAMVEIWQADASGRYHGDFGWGRCGTDADGRFRFRTVVPGPVPAADGTPRAPHVWVLVFARGLLKPVLTRMSFPGAGADPLLAALEPDERDRLVAAPDGEGRYRFDVHLQGDHQTPFFVV